MVHCGCCRSPATALSPPRTKKITLSNGKTYAATNYQINSVAISNGGSIAALADVIYDQFRLPIDYYVTVDMQALVDMVDNFGGIEVYIPHDMSYGGSKLLKGYRNLNGASAEFFVRCRHGDGYANSDIDRLNMQRYFYAGLFKRARAMGVTDILNQLPLVFKNYIKTDMDISTIAKLVVSFLKLDSSNIILAQTPVFMGVPNVGKTDTFAGYSCVVPDAGSIANLLNQYFCTYTGPIDVSEMNLVTDEWPHGSASTDANVQYMGRIDKESDDAILSGDTDLDGAVTTDGQAAGSANLKLTEGKIIWRTSTTARRLPLRSQRSWIRKGPRCARAQGGKPDRAHRLLCHCLRHFHHAGGVSGRRGGVRAFPQKGLEPYSTEGYDSKNWVLLDYSNVIVHVFVPNTRTYYDLEHLWADGEPIDISEYLNPRQHP